MFVGVKSTAPVVVFTLQVLPLASVNVVCCPAVPRSRSIVEITILLPVPFAVSFAAMLGKVTGVFNVVVVESSVAVGGAGVVTVTLRFAVALCPSSSCTVYGIVAKPVKLFAGVKSTAPVVVFNVQVLPLASVKVVCCPAVPGSRSMVEMTMLLPVPFAVSLAAMFGKVTGVFKVVVVESSVAVGGAGVVTVTLRFAVALCPS